MILRVGNRRDIGSYFPITNPPPLISGKFQIGMCGLGLTFVRWDLVLVVVAKYNRSRLRTAPYRSVRRFDRSQFFSGGKGIPALNKINAGIPADALVRNRADPLISRIYRRLGETSISFNEIPVKSFRARRNTG